MTLPKKSTAKKFSSYQTYELLTQKIIHKEIHANCEVFMGGGFCNVTQKKRFLAFRCYFKCRDVFVPVYACFIDKKSFDEVQHEKLICKYKRSKS